MTPEKATYRYLKTFIPAMCVYAVGSISITWIGENSNQLSAIRYLLALVPILAIFFTFWAHWRFATEVDEFLRLIQIKGTLFAIACVMIVASGWGTMEMLADAPRLSVFWLLPIFGLHNLLPQHSSPSARAYFDKELFKAVARRTGMVTVSVRRTPRRFATVD